MIRCACARSNNLGDCIENVRRKFPDGQMFVFSPRRSEERGPCSECLCNPGRRHHLGCPRERCPRCGNFESGCHCRSMRVDAREERVTA